MDVSKIVLRFMGIDSRLKVLENAIFGKNCTNDCTALLMEHEVRELEIILNSIESNCLDYALPKDFYLATMNNISSIRRILNLNNQNNQE